MVQPRFETIASDYQAQSCLRNFWRPGGVRSWIDELGNVIFFSDRLSGGQVTQAGLYSRQFEANGAGLGCSATDSLVIALLGEAAPNPPGGNWSYLNEYAALSSTTGGAVQVSHGEVLVPGGTSSAGAIVAYRDGSATSALVYPGRSVSAPGGTRLLTDSGLVAWARPLVGGVPQRRVAFPSYVTAGAGGTVTSAIIAGSPSSPSVVVESVPFGAAGFQRLDGSRIGMSDSGLLGFVAIHRAEAAGATRVGLWAHDGATLSPVLQSGDAVPGLAGYTVDRILGVAATDLPNTAVADERAALAVNKSGQLAFVVSASNGSQGTTAVLAGAPGSLQLALKLGAVVPVTVPFKPYNETASVEETITGGWSYRINWLGNNVSIDDAGRVAVFATGDVFRTTTSGEETLPRGEFRAILVWGPVGVSSGTVMAAMERQVVTSRWGYGDYSSPILNALVQISTGPDRPVMAKTGLIGLTGSLASLDLDGFGFTPFGQSVLSWMPGVGPMTIAVVHETLGSIDFTGDFPGTADRRLSGTVELRAGAVCEPAGGYDPCPQGASFGYLTFGVSSERKPGATSEASAYPEVVSVHRVTFRLKCSPADIAGTDGSDGPDNAVDNGDYDLFFTWFFNSNCSGPCEVPSRACNPADIARSDGTPGADGCVNNGDFSLFYSSFFAGCQPCSKGE